MRRQKRVVVGSVAAGLLLAVFVIVNVMLNDIQLRNRGLTVTFKSDFAKESADTERTVHVTDLDSIHLARREHVERVCRQRPSEFKIRGDLSRFFSFSDLHKLVYCTVQKVGCSFWLQVMKILTGQIPGGTLYRGTFYHVVGMRGSNYSFIPKDVSEKQRMLRTYKKFMFVRDPYSRIFSAYMDKVFNPTEQMHYVLKRNRMLRYNATGVEHPKSADAKVMHTRSNDTTVSHTEKTKSKTSSFLNVSPPYRSECETNISFKVFVETIASQRNLLDPHFSAMFRHCDPCSVHFDYIGKMETFVPDTEYILKKAGVNLSLLTDDKKLLREGNDIVIIRDFAKSVLFFRRSLSKRCSPRYLCDVYFRMWVTLQTRGLISIGQPYPFPYDNCDPPRVTNPVSRFIEAHLNSGNRSERVRQRHMAMMEAYYRLPRSTLKKLEQFVKSDCDLFGYECNIDKRFPVGGYTPSKFSFFRSFW